MQWLLGIMFVFAPLFRSGQPALVVLMLELFAVLLLALVFWQPHRRVLRFSESLALGLLLVVPLLYLIPLPAHLVDTLPGRQIYLAAQELMGRAPRRYATLSIAPLETERAWLLLLVPVGVFVGTRLLDARRAYRLVLLLLGIGAAQALLGLLQFGADAGSPQLFGLSVPEFRSAMGTYTNRNHLAGLLEMLLPIAIALMIYSIGRHDAQDRSLWRERVAFYASARGHAAFVHGVIALLLLLGLIFSRSRGGIALSMLGIFLSTVLLAWRIGGANVYGPTRTILAFALGIGVTIGLVPVLDRFSVEGAVEDARWTIFSSTLDGIGVFNPVGSGPGSYPDVFRAFQPAELGQWFINHAHNDYLEWLFEGGLVAAALALLMLALFARQWGRVWSPEAWPRFRFVQVGAGIGILLLLLHSLVDYNLHIPANMTYLAFLAGVFSAEPQDDGEAVGRRRRKRRPPDLEDQSLASSAAVSVTPSVPEQRARNPFDD